MDLLVLAAGPLRPVHSVGLGACAAEEMDPDTLPIGCMCYLENGR